MVWKNYFHIMLKVYDFHFAGATPLMAALKSILRVTKLKITKRSLLDINN